MQGGPNLGISGASGRTAAMQEMSGAERDLPPLAAVRSVTGLGIERESSVVRGGI